MRLIIVYATLVMVACDTRTTAYDPASREYVIAGEPTCSTCRIERRLVVTINDSLFRGGALVGRAAQVHVARNGTYLIHGLGSDMVYLADSSGQVIQQIGQKGKGPGEFILPRAVQELDSSYLIFDQRMRRVTRLSIDGFEVQSVLPMPASSRMRYVAFGDGRYVLSARIDTAEQQGYPVHLVAPDGRVIRSFGGRRIEPGLRDRVFERVLAQSGDSAIWVGYSGRYRLEKWDTSGHLRLAIERNVPWFPPVDSQAWKFQRSDFARGHPLLAAIYEDRDGLVWICAWVRRPDYVPPPGEDYSDAFNIVIEVLDPIAGRLLASKWFRTLAGYSGTGGFYQSTYRVSATGEPLFDVWTFDLHRDKR